MALASPILAPPDPEDYATEIDHGPTLRPIMVRLADEGVPLSCIARSFRVPLAAVHETIAAALTSARLLQSPPTDWPPSQPSDRRQGRPVRMAESELITSLQHRYDITRQQALLLVVMLKRELATKEVLHAAAQAVHGPGQETSRKLVDVLICKLRKRMRKHGHVIETIWGGGYFLSEQARKTILRQLGLVIADVNPSPIQVPLKRPTTGVPVRAGFRASLRAMR